MKTEKTRGDILAEQIEEIIDNPNAEPFHSRMRKALDDYRAPESVLTPAQIADGWIEWHGGECPVWGGSTPTVMYRDKETYSPVAGNVRWRHIGLDGDIIAYRPDPYEALKKAHSEGKVIQSDNDGEWRDLRGSIMWSMAPAFYRIKPSPVMVPLGPEDVPPGSVVRHKNWGNNVSWCIVEGVGKNALSYGSQLGHGWTREWIDLKEQGFEISRDGGKTWQRCEKEAK